MQNGLYHSIDLYEAFDSVRHLHMSHERIYTTTCPELYAYWQYNNNKCQTLVINLSQMDESANIGQYNL